MSTKLQRIQSFPQGGLERDKIKLEFKVAWRPWPAAVIELVEIEDVTGNVRKSQRVVTQTVCQWCLV